LTASGRGVVTIRYNASMWPLPMRKPLCDLSAQSLSAAFSSLCGLCIMVRHFARPETLYSWGCSRPKKV